MKYQFDKLCVCLTNLGYESTKQWWHLCLELQARIFGALRDRDPQAEFNYRQAYEITYHDGMKDCTCGAIEENKKK